MVVAKIIRYSIIMDDFLKKLGMQIKKYRELRDYTQEALAGKLNSATSTISDWENGKSFLEYPSILNLCKALDITVEDLFSFAQPSSANSDLDMIISIVQQQSPTNQRKILEALKIFTV